MFHAEGASSEEFSPPFSLSLSGRKCQQAQAYSFMSEFVQETRKVLVELGPGLAENFEFIDTFHITDFITIVR